MELGLVKEDPHADTKRGSVDMEAIQVEKEERKFEHENYWLCCSGSTIDKRAITFITQTIMVLIILIFSMYMIVSADADNDITVWVSILSAIVGNFLPSQSSPLGLSSSGSQKH